MASTKFRTSYRYIVRQLEARIDPNVPLDIRHRDSLEHPALQAVDMFCWAFFQKYERDNPEWINHFGPKNLVLFDQSYL